MVHVMLKSKCVCHMHLILVSDTCPFLQYLTHVSCCSVWYGDNSGPGYCVCDDGYVWRAQRDRRWCLPPHHHSAVRGRTHCVVAGRAVAKRLV